MANTDLGRKKHQIIVNPSRLHPDSKNPRLTESTQNKSEIETLKTLKKEFDLRELADSMTQNGYFDEEPLIIVPKDLPAKFKGVDITEEPHKTAFSEFINTQTTEFTVIEGNRRLATVKILLDENLRTSLNATNWPTPEGDKLADLQQIPSIVYAERKEVIPYLGVRHISGIKKWEPYAKARYITSMVQEGMSIDEVQRMVGDRGTSTRKIYLCYKLVSQVELEEEGAGEDAKELFSYLLLALGQGPIKEYLGLPKDWVEVNLDTNQPIVPEKVPNLMNFFMFLFGNKSTGKRPVISESRDITKKLTHILRSTTATAQLISHWNIDDAFDLSDGEESLLLKQLQKANFSLEKANGIVHRYKDNVRIKEEVEKIKGTLKQLSKNMS